MKSNKSVIFIAVITSLIAVACAKQLEVSPQNAIPQGSLGVNDIDQLRTGMYSRMEDVIFSFWFDFDKRGENVQAGPGATLIDPVGMTSTDADIAAMWQNAYSGINVINFLIGRVDELGNTASPTILSTKGEALYFRALIYYNLVTRWGGVPIVLTNTNEAIQRSTETEVWDQIKSDLQAARTLVGGYTGYLYVSDQAVKALMARVYLSMGDNNNAALYADSVINFNNGQFALSTDALSYSGMFISGTASKEVIFALANKSTANPHLFYSFTNDTKASWIYSATSFNYNNLFLDQRTPVIKQGDRRKAATFTSDITRIIKYPNGKAGQQLAAPPDPNATPIIISRLAEMHLIKAEAQGPANGAATLTPYFTARYENPPLPGTIAALSPEAYKDMILNERRREFYCEGHWWYDVKRNGRTDLLTTLGNRTYLLYYPIPQVQKDLAGYTQNEGY